MADAMTRANGGGTFVPSTMDAVGGADPAHFLSGIGAYSKMVPAAKYAKQGKRAIQSYRKAHEKLFAAHPNFRLGTWVDPDTGNLHLDVVKAFTKANKAVAYAKKQGQIAAFDLSTFADLPTGLSEARALSIQKQLAKATKTKKPTLLARMWWEQRGGAEIDMAAGQGAAKPATKAAAARAAKATKGIWKDSAGVEHLPLGKEPGTVPVPPGFVRLYHYTGKIGDIVSIARTGIRNDLAKGESYMEPSQIWASASKPDEQIKDFAEFAIRSDDPRLDIGRFDYPYTNPKTGKPHTAATWAEQMNAGGRDVTIPFGDILPGEIVNYSEPWMGHARYLMNEIKTRAQLHEPQFGPGTHTWAENLQELGPEYRTAYEWLDKHLPKGSPAGAQGEIGAAGKAGASGGVTKPKRVISAKAGESVGRFVEAQGAGKELWERLESLEPKAREAAYAALSKTGAVGKEAKRAAKTYLTSRMMEDEIAILGKSARFDPAFLPGEVLRDLRAAGVSVADIPASIGQSGVEGLVSRIGGMVKIGEKVAPSSEHWYSAAGRLAKFAARKEHIGASKMTDLIGVFSPSEEVTQNVKNAIKAARLWHKIVKEAGGVKQALPKGINPKTGKAWKVGDGGILTPEAWRSFMGKGQVSEGTYFSKLQKAERVLYGLGFAGRKTNSFSANILKYADPRKFMETFQTKKFVTLDRQIAAFALGKEGFTEKEYEFVEKVFQTMAKRAGLEPEQLQAMSWVPMKAMGLKAGYMLRHGGKSKSGMRAWSSRSADQSGYMDRAADAFQKGMKAMYPGYGFDEMGKATKRAGGGVMSGGRPGKDSIPALLAPGEVVLNASQIARLTGNLGIPNSGHSLFKQATKMATGGVVPTTMYRGSGTGAELRGTRDGGTTIEQITITVPPQFNDTEWAIQQGLRKARFALMEGF